MLGLDLFLALVIGVTHGDLPGCGRYSDLAGVLECGALLTTYEIRLKLSRCEKIVVSS